MVQAQERAKSKSLRQVHKKAKPVIIGLMNC